MKDTLERKISRLSSDDLRIAIAEIKLHIIDINVPMRSPVFSADFDADIAAAKASCLAAYRRLLHHLARELASRPDYTA